jgi:hypothetical protein
MPGPEVELIGFIYELVVVALEPVNGSDNVLETDESERVNNITKKGGHRRAKREKDQNSLVDSNVLPVMNVLDVVDDPDNNEPLEKEGPAVPPLREEAEVHDNDDNDALVDSVVPHSDIRL